MVSVNQRLISLVSHETSPAAKSEEKRMFSQARETSSSLVHLLNSPCKGVQDSIEFSIVCCGFCGSFSVKLRFRIPKVRGQTEWIPDSSSCITASYALVDSGFNKQKFPGFRIPQAKFPRISLNEVILNDNIFSQF